MLGNDIFNIVWDIELVSKFELYNFLDVWSYNIKWFLNIVFVSYFLMFNYEYMPYIIHYNYLTPLVK